jgi:hypothetical protein
MLLLLLLFLSSSSSSLSSTSSPVTGFLHRISLEPVVTPPHHSGFKFHTAVLTILCVMFQV